MSGNDNFGNYCFCHDDGFSLIEVLIAILLFSITTLSLLSYQQSLLRQFYALQQGKQGWRFAQQLLDTYPTALDHPSLEAPWQTQLTVNYGADGCQIVTATVITPDKQQASLTRWFCDGLSP